MLRIGKNAKDQEDNEHSAEKQPEAVYSSSQRSYASYQPADTQPKPPIEASASPRALTESESLARDIKEGTLSGFVGGGTVVTGEATFKAMMRIDGHLSGRITSSSGTLVVGTGGKVDANIEVAVATIHGTLNGDIIATQRLELGRAARVNGNIQTPSLVIEQGAIFEGSCKMLQLNAAQDKSKKSYKSLDDRALDTTGMQPLSTDRTTKTSDIPNVSDVAS